MGINLFKHITKKTLTFGFSGALGALIGSGCTEFFLLSEYTGIGGTIFHTAIWTGIISLGIALALLTTQNLYLKKKVFSKAILNAAFRGVLTGGIAGGIAQIVFFYTATISVPIEIISRIICWGIFGLGTGWGISKFVPNYSQRTAMIAGFFGGVIGGTAFRFSFNYMPIVSSRLLGVAIIGFFIGLMISYIEELLREAWLTVIWGKDEKSSISLGAKPIVLGSSSEADIYLPKEKGFPPITAIIKLNNSKVFIDNKISNQSTELRNGSKIMLGSIEVIINTR